jgi:hypothetical protein
VGGMIVHREDVLSIVHDCLGVPIESMTDE